MDKTQVVPSDRFIFSEVEKNNLPIPSTHNKYTILAKISPLFWGKIAGLPIEEMPCFYSLELLRHYQINLQSTRTEEIFDFIKWILVSDMEELGFPDIKDILQMNLRMNNYGTMEDKIFDMIHKRKSIFNTIEWVKGNINKALNS